MILHDQYAGLLYQMLTSVPETEATILNIQVGSPNSASHAA